MKNVVWVEAEGSSGVRSVSAAEWRVQEVGRSRCVLFPVGLSALCSVIEECYYFCGGVIVGHLTVVDRFR